MNKFHFDPPKQTGWVVTHVDGVVAATQHQILVSTQNFPKTSFCIPEAFDDLSLMAGVDVTTDPFAISSRGI